MNHTFKINWIKQKKNTAVWKCIPHYVFSNVGGLSFVFMCDNRRSFTFMRGGHPLADEPRALFMFYISYIYVPYIPH